MSGCDFEKPTFTVPMGFTERGSRNYDATFNSETPSVDWNPTISESVVRLQRFKPKHGLDLPPPIGLTVCPECRVKGDIFPCGWGYPLKRGYRCQNGCKFVIHEMLAILRVEEFQQQQDQGP